MHHFDYNDITLTYHICDEHRITDFSIISEGEIPIETAKILIGAYINAYDYYGKRPFLIFSIPKPLKVGKVFQDVYLLKPKQIPEHNTHFLVNGEFLRNCLPKEIRDEETGDMLKLHTHDAIELLLNEPTSREELTHLQINTGCFFIGVCGNNPIHFTRGASHALWK